MGEVIHVLNIMKCMDSDVMYVIHVYNDIWNATYSVIRFTYRSSEIKSCHKTYLRLSAVQKQNTLQESFIRPQTWAAQYQAK